MDGDDDEVINDADNNAKGVERGNEKEWYYGNADKERNGPISFMEMKDLYAEGTVTAKTKVWAHGMDGWRLVHQVS